MHAVWRSFLAAIVLDDFPLAQHFTLNHSQADMQPPRAAESKEAAQVLVGGSAADAQSQSL